MSSFSRFASVVAATKRTPPISGGKRGLPAPYLSGIACTPLDPAGVLIRDETFRRRPELKTAYTLLVCYVDAALDIVDGDVLVVAGRDYPIRLANHWAWRGTQYLQLVIEDVQ